MAAVPGVRFLPNAITVLALCAGLTSVAFAMSGVRGDPGAWRLAVGAIGAAAILDSLDGPAARWLRSTSRVGAELDSLSDCISFGVAPALVMYIWLLRDEARGYGWRGQANRKRNKHVEVNCYCKPAAAAKRPSNRAQARSGLTGNFMGSSGTMEMEAGISSVHERRNHAAEAECLKDPVRTSPR